MDDQRPRWHRCYMCGAENVQLRRSPVAGCLIVDYHLAGVLGLDRPVICVMSGTPLAHRWL
ncbi:hypothetical protein ACWEKT_19840 [Nocardia takedensis]|uniref:hypothetical protein n=1 Tax=Nocardia takedensis TaxID=259390 RepID=UPI0002EA05B4|nr:hypothetical protein [Nocardia takedensis]